MTYLGHDVRRSKGLSGMRCDFLSSSRKIMGPGQTQLPFSPDWECKRAINYEAMYIFDCITAKYVCIWEAQRSCNSTKPNHKYDGLTFSFLFVI